jgi:hypothetical protein
MKVGVQQTEMRTKDPSAISPLGEAERRANRVRLPSLMTGFGIILASPDTESGGAASRWYQAAHLI